MRIRSLAGAGLVLSALSVTACSGASSAGSAATGSGGTGSAATGSGASESSAGTSQGGQGSSATLDVCKMMTAKHASSIVGVTYSKATSGVNMCTYTTTDAPIGMYILIFPNSSGTAAWKEQVGQMAEDGGAKPYPLSGFSYPAEASATGISAQVGSDIIDVNGGDPSSNTTTYPRSSAIIKAIASQLH